MEMERKKASALVSLLMVLLASFALVAQIPLVYATAENHRYWVMTIAGPPYPGNVAIIDSLNDAPIEEGYWNFTIPPRFACQNITFSDDWELSGYEKIVDLTVPTASYNGIDYMFKSRVPPYWFRFSTSMSEDGYGWIFLNATGDVDCHTFSNDTAVYWHYPSPKAGEKAADHDKPPSPGPDGVAGTGDDGFGDGTPDPPGSSILVVTTTLSAEWNDPLDPGPWKPLFSMSWPQVFTTGNATSRIIESASEIDGVSQSEVGQPWEFYAGLDNPQKKVPYEHPKWNAYVTYVCAWAMLNIATDLGPYDNCFTITERKVREDCVIADISCDEKVTITDVVIAALAFGSEGMHFGPDNIPYTGDDKTSVDPNWDARGDFKPDDPALRGKITISDIVRIALDFGASLTPDCIIRP